MFHNCFCLTRNNIFLHTRFTVVLSRYTAPCTLTYQYLGKSQKNKIKSQKYHLLSGGRLPLHERDCHKWVTARICLSVQMFKLPNIWMFQTSTKSLPNHKICGILSVKTGCFLSKFHFYSDLIQISKYPNLTRILSYIR